ncbi:MAG: hypothetical protein J6K53_17465 [Roseburia sp.]|nr:hypothetical protein [Roseburia sp.]
MSIENYSYLWNEKKADFVLVKTDFGYGIVDKKEQSMLLISDEELEQKIISKMLENGNKVYDNINQAYSDV